MRYIKLISDLEKLNIDLLYSEGFMEAYQDITFCMGGRKIIIECCTNQISITSKSNHNLVEESFDLSSFKSSNEVLKYIKKIDN